MKSFRDPVTGVLKAFGSVDFNAEGDLVREEPENFNLAPGKWQLVGGEWVTAAPTKAERIAHIQETVAGGRDRTTVQLAILVGEMVLAPYAAQLYGVSLEIALMGVYARNKTYRLCKDAETLIEAIEDET